MNTTKIVVALEMPNQMMAKIAQIADDTVFITGITGSKNSPARLFAPRKMPNGQTYQRRNDKPHGDAPERNTEIAPQIAVGGDKL